ncbi:hypothetical protein [Methylopila sp. 73B]|uniref:hypothetical protein n=1 Tax=Methylopila sp. 73B TaxID=1120792 RepID=UPI00035DA141|nr:hypothetical protein [Methylopila sp. 73B]
MTTDRETEARAEGATVGLELARAAIRQSRQNPTDEQRAQLRAGINRRVKAGAASLKIAGEPEAVIDAWLAGLQSAFTREVDAASRVIKSALSQRGPRKAGRA